MTKTALANKELATKERIASEDRKASIAKAFIPQVKFSGKLGGLAAHAVTRATRNDVNWYLNYIKDPKQFANVPNFFRLGSNTLAGLVRKVNGVNKEVPGIMILNYMTSVGNQPSAVTDLPVSPINSIAARSKEKVLALNSRSSVEWEASDLMYNLICTQEILSLILEMSRAYKAYTTYRNDNNYLARSLVTALGVDFDDLQRNAAEWRKNLELLVNRFNNAIVAPADVSAFARKAYLASNVFMDKKVGTNGQMYAYKIAGVYRLNDAGDTLNFMPWNSDYLVEQAQPRLWTCAKFTAIINDLMTQIIDHPDFQAMYQDLRHAFQGNIFQIVLDYDAGLEFNVDEINRQQIHNTKTLPSACVAVEVSETSYAPIIVRASMDENANHARWDGMDIHQDSNGYLYQGTLEAAGAAVYRRVLVNHTTLSRTAYPGIINSRVRRLNFLINTYDKPADAFAVIENTRNITSGVFTDLQSIRLSEFQIQIETCGSEIFLYNTMFDHSALYEYGTDNYVAINIDHYNDQYIETDMLCAYSCFDWAPMVNILKFDPTTPSYVGSDHNYLINDICNPVVINIDTLNSIHDFSVISEYYLQNTQFKG